MNRCLIILTLFLGGCASISVPISTPELHVIGVYEGYDNNKKAKNNSRLSPASFGEVIVNISKTDSPLVLAFSAYDRTKWIVNTKKDVKIEKVILSGYHQQKIEGISEGTLVEVYTHDSSPCEYCYQGKGYFYSYKSPPESKLKELTGLDISSWQGKYNGREFSIFNNIPTLSK